MDAKILKRNYKSGNGWSLKEIEIQDYDFKIKNISLNNDKIHFVFFYLNECNHCRSFINDCIWSELINKNKNKEKLVFHQFEYRELENEFEKHKLNEFPTLRFYNHDKIYNFIGNRTSLDSLEECINSML